MTDGRTTFASGWPLKVSRIGISERAVVAQVGVSGSRRHPSHFSDIVRGGTVIGLMAAASGGLVFQMAGFLIIAGIGGLFYAGEQFLNEQGDGGLWG